MGPFSIVLGKHSRAFDTADFPFSVIEATAEGRSFILPGINLGTVGTLRDSTKWPARDHRRGLQRDRICFDLLNPFTVGRMMRGDARLEQLQSTPDTVETVALGGVEIKRVLISRGRRYYRLGIELYLLEQLVTQLENNSAPLQEVLATSPEAVYSETWVDVGGLLMPHQRLQDLFTRIEERTIETLPEVRAALDHCFARYADDVWAWVHPSYRQVFGIDLDTAGPDDLLRAIDLYAEKRTRFLEMVLADARHEFDESARIGFGPYDGTDGAEAEFRAVRGSGDDHPFISQLHAELEALGPRLDRLKQHLDKMLHTV